MRKLILSLVFIGIFFLHSSVSIQAQEVLGIHILAPGEINEAKELLQTSSNESKWKHVTVPFTLTDIEKGPQWQAFFDECEKYKFIPILRLATKAEGNYWTVPTKKDIVQLTSALKKLDWPTEERLVIVFNEPNHAKEWGNSLDPEEYADVLAFTSSWLKTEKEKYIVLPAGMDLAAPNGNVTMEAFTYWRRAMKHNPELLASIDAWNSHSYPNPGFSSAPAKKDKMSLRGYQHELAFVEPLASKKFDVYITETGWEENYSTTKKLESYYAYAAKNIWSDERIKAVTPFLLKGAPGPFEKFSFFDESGEKTKQFEAYRKVIETASEQEGV